MLRVRDLPSTMRRPAVSTGRWPLLVLRSQRSGGLNWCLERTWARTLRTPTLGLMVTRFRALFSARRPPPWIVIDIDESDQPPLRFPRGPESTPERPVFHEQGQPIDPEEFRGQIAWVRALARRLVFDENEAEDLAQETLLAALERSGRPLSDWKSWFSRVLRNRRHSRDRRERRRRQRERHAARSEAAPATDEIMERAETQRRLVEAVFALKEPFRSTVLLRYFEGLGTNEIAERQGVAPATVRSRLKRGLDTLRDSLDRDFGDRKKWATALLALFLPASDGTAKADGSCAGGRSPLSKSTVPSIAPTLPFAFCGVLALLVVAAAIFWTERPADPAAGEATAAEIRRAPSVPASPEETVVVALPEAPRAPEPATGLRGVVVDGLDAPIAGARVRILHHPWARVAILDWELESLTVSGAETRSGPDGTFELDLPRGEEVILAVEAPGFARVVLPERNAGERVTVVLPRPARLEIAVTDEAGLLVGDAIVRLSQKNELWRGGTTFDHREVTTDSRGESAFADLPPGAFRLLVMDRRIAWSRVVLLDVEEGRTLRREFVRRRSRVLSGRVVDKETGKPLRAKVGVGLGLEPSVTTDENGVYTLPASSAPLDLFAEAEGFAQGHAEVRAGNGPDFELLRGLEWEGRLVDPAGAPIAGALVTAFASQMRLFEGGTQVVDAASAFSEDDGTFFLRDLHPEIPHVLAVQAPGFARTIVAPDSEENPQMGTAGARHEPRRLNLGDVELAPGRRIEGVALDAAGRPIKGALVIARAGVFASRILGDYLTTEERRTDHLGRFVFPDLAPGCHVLTLRTPVAIDITHVVELDDAHEDPERVALELEGLRELAVLVEDSGGEPVSCPVTVSSGRNRVCTLTDADGRALVHVRATEDVRVSVAPGPDYLRSKALVVPPAETEAVVVIEPAARIGGVVLDGTDASVADVEVAVRSSVDGHLLASEFSDHEGRFEASVPRGSVVDLVVSGARKLCAQCTRTALSEFRGELRGVLTPIEDLELRATRAGREKSLEIVVRDDDGVPVPGARAVLRGMSVFPVVVPNPDGKMPLVLYDLAKETIEVRPLGPESSEHQWRGVSQTIVPEGQRVELKLRRGRAPSEMPRFAVPTRKETPCSE